MAGEKEKPKGMKVQLKEAKEQVATLTNNLNLLKAYFREYDLLNHYLAWIKFKAGEGKKPENLKINE